MEGQIAVMPQNSLEAILQPLIRMFECMSLGRCIHPM